MAKSEERRFLDERVVPLLRRLGFNRVVVTHGSDEFGRDVVFTDVDRFGIEKVFAAQVKVGKVSGAARENVLAQIDDAFKMPWHDERDGTEHYISGFYLVTSGKFTRNAKEKVRQKFRGRPLWFLDGAAVSALEARSLQPEKPVILELARLKHEAQAAMRHTPKDLSLFEQKLGEIDLLEGLTPHDRVEAIQDLALEISLNSGVGTKVLVQELLRQIAGWDNPLVIADTPGVTSAGGLLTSIATSLWEMGVQAVEYGLSCKTIRTILDALEHVYEVAGPIAATAAQTSCKDAVENMLVTAKRDRGEDIVQLLQSSRLLRDKAGPAAK